MTICRQLDGNLTTETKTQTDISGLSSVSALLEHHVEGAVVEAVSSDDPHEFPMDHSLMGGPAQGLAEGLDVRHHPVRLGGWH